MAQRKPRWVGFAEKPTARIETHTTKIGGTPHGLPAGQWPQCRQCRHPLRFVLQLDLRSPLLLSSAYQLAFLFLCEGYEDERGCHTWDAEAGANAIVFASGPSEERTPSPANIGFFPERAVDWTDYIPVTEENEDSGFINRESWEQVEQALETTSDDEDIVITVPEHYGAPETLLIGGDPQWLQSDESPTCPRCSGPLRLLAQIDALIDAGCGDAESYWLPFGSGGVGYMFICDRECHPSGSAFLWQTT